MRLPDKFIDVITIVNYVFKNSLGLNRNKKLESGRENILEKF